MADDPDREGLSEHAGVYDAPFEVVIESVASDQTVRCTEYDGDELDSPMHPDTTVFGEPYGITGRPPKDTECLTLESKGGLDWVISANVDRPAVSAEGNTIVYEMYQSGSTWVVGSMIKLEGDIRIDPRAGKKTYTTGTTYIGSDTATEKMVLGLALTSAFNVFLSAVTGWSKELNTLKGAAADVAVRTYATNVEGLVNTLAATVANWTSTKHRIDS